jgi:hypothetical protein
LNPRWGLPQSCLANRCSQPTSAYSPRCLRKAEDPTPSRFNDPQFSRLVGTSNVPASLSVSVHQVGIEPTRAFGPLSLKPSTSTVSSLVDGGPRFLKKRVPEKLCTPGRSRTDTVLYSHRFLRPARLPISPQGYKTKNPIGYEPTGLRIIT